MSARKTGGTKNKSAGANPADLAFRLFSGLCALVIVLLVGGMVLELFLNSRPSIHKFGLGFLWSTAWNPVSGDFGALTSMFGSVVSTVIALVLAIPLSIVTALFLVEIAPPLVSRVVGAAIELLAAIPSIIYGMWGMFVFAPWLALHVQPFLGEHLGFLPLFKGPPIGLGMMTAGIILALMILPFICAVTRDVFFMVPSVVKESAFGMGSTTWEATRKVVIPYGIRGIIGACFLGLGRAIGETMAITFVIGNDHRISASLFATGNSIASTLANELGEASDKIYLSSLVELGLVLFGITIVVQIIAHLWLKRVRLSMGSGL